LFGLHRPDYFFVRRATFLFAQPFNKHKLVFEHRASHVFVTNVSSTVFLVYGDVSELEKMFTGTQFGRYEIRSKLGEGGMGEVYAALDPVLERSVAIKLLPTEFTLDDDRRSRFRQEARVVSALNHPNIITIYEIGENEHGSFLATEFVEGTTLRELIKRETLSLPRVLKIVEQTANALVAAHHAGIVHRDIKPENIMVRDDSIVKVLDFGLAKPKVPIGDEENNENNRTIPGTVMGSARYMSPEQARGLEVDERTDIWSLGVVLYEMLMGNAPFDGETTADTIAAVVYKEPEPLVDHLPNIPSELSRIVRKALQKDREERYQDVKDLALDIKDLLHELEHANSGNRSGHTSSSPNFSENPTMIHRTVSGNHPTEQHVAVVSEGVRPHDRRKVSRIRTAVAVSLGMLLASAIGFGFYAWFDSPARLSDTAFVKPQISRINTDGRVMLPAISPDGKYVAYVSGEIGSRSLVVRQIATDSTITVVPTTPLNLQSIGFSPSGDHIYYTQTNNDFTISTLYQVPTLGGPSKRMIEDVDSAVAFAPDGKQFAFVRHIPKTNDDLIVVVNTSTLEQQEFISTEATEYDFFVPKLAWSPDGLRILTGAGLRQSGFVTRTDIVEIAVGSKEVKAINSREFFTAGNFAWLADGSGYVFTGRMTQNDAVQVWLASYPVGQLHQVTNDLNDYVDLGIAGDGRSIVTIKGDATGSIWRYSTADKTAAQITSDSRNVEGKGGLFQRTDGALIFTRNDGKEADLWLADADGKNGRALFQEAGFALDPVASRDGRFVVFNLQKDKRSRIWRMNTDGTGAVPLTEDDPDIIDLSPQITPDGKTVIFQRRIANEDRFKLMKVAIDGGKPEVFYENEARGVFHPRISPDGKRIAFASYDMATFGKTLHIATIDGANFGKVERDVEYNLINGFVWAPDSRELTILTNRGGSQNLWRQPIDGSAAAPITDFKSGRIFNYQWSSNGKDILIARGSVNNDLILIRDGLIGDGTSDVTKRQTGSRRRANS